MIVDNPFDLGARIQPTPALMRVVRGDYLRDINVYILPAPCMLCLLV